MDEYTSKVSSSAPAETHRSSSVPPRLLRLFALYESLLHFVLPLCSALRRPSPEMPVVSATNIVDISGVGLRQFWNLKGHMQDASVLATAHYPETLDRIFVGTWNDKSASELTLADYWRTCVLSHCLGLDQAMVRSSHGFKD